MENTEKVEIGYTVPKERWQEAAQEPGGTGERAGRWISETEQGRARGKRTRTTLWRTSCWPAWRFTMWRSSQRTNAGSFRCPARTEVNMLAVLMSMKPEWWEKILAGEKTLEIRKTHPQNERLEWPVTVLVYVSGTGAVQGQFLCPGEVSYRTMQDLEEMSCVPREDLLKYAKGRRLSGWIVQSPEKFDAPSPLQSSAWTVRPCRGSMWRSRTRRRIENVCYHGRI